MKVKIKLLVGGFYLLLAFNGTAQVSTVVANALAFKAMLTSTQQATLQLTYTSSLARKWSNLPCGTSCRNGLQMGTNLTTAQLTAAMLVIKSALSTSTNDGYDEYRQSNLAEAYLHVNGGGNGYDSTLRWICFLGTPSNSGSWMLQFGGHHFAENIAFNAGHVIGATPYFQGVEPKTFTYNSVAYTPLSDERDALASMLAGLTTAQLTTARNSSSFSDCTLIPGETNGGSGAFPATKVGIACSTLTSTQQNLVLTAIGHYVNDMDATTAAAVMAVYTSEINGTYLSYTGNGISGSASSFLNANSNYVRIDGPSVWIEFSCQNGIVIQGQIHYHTVWRDHSHDYGVDLTGSAIDGNGLTATITPSGSTAICSGGSVVLNANTGTGYTYQWKINTVNISGATSSSYTAIAAGNYTVTVTSGINAATSSATSVTVNALPTATLTASGATTFCSGGSVTLNANTGTGLTYQWKLNGVTISGAVGSSFNATNSGVFTCIVTNSAGCTGSASITTFVNSNPVPSISGNTSFCSGSSTTLNAGAGYNSYLWSTLATTATISVGSAGNFTCTVTNVSGCTGSATVTTTINPLPAVSFSGLANSYFVTDPPASLTGSPPGGMFSGTGISGNAFSAASAGVGGPYTISYLYTDGNGCSKSSSQQTSVINPPPVEAYLKLFLEGYYSGGGMMNNSGSGGCLFITGQSTNLLDADFVTVSAMLPGTPFSLVESQTVVLKIDGSLHVTFSSGVITGNAYYLRITHRNSLETWSTSPVVISSTSSGSPYNFTSSAAKAYGGNESNLGDGNFGIFSGDISDALSATIGLQDGVIESQDYSDMQNAVYATLLGYVTQDITGNGIVESEDYVLMENNIYFFRMKILP